MAIFAEIAFKNLTYDVCHYYYDITVYKILFVVYSYLFSKCEQKFCYNRSVFFSEVFIERDL